MATQVVLFTVRYHLRIEALPQEELRPILLSAFSPLEVQETARVAAATAAAAAAAAAATTTTTITTKTTTTTRTTTTTTTTTNVDENHFKRRKSIRKSIDSNGR
uniref:Uncharacterized protein n=1 Tax=Vespula pensylvanica TaxID=30213 RepID=A0A834UGH9_VESPE|nr:hypothetical protein H0235_001132 [Vespula pensylvanica]